MGSSGRRRGGWVLGLLLLVTRAAVLHAQTCASPLSIPAGGGAFTGTTSGASAITLSCASATSTSPEHVYTWTPSASGTAVIQTCGSNFDTVVAAETQC